MPISRYHIRNVYSFGNPELYQVADKDNLEALLEGVAMAGLIGVLCQLGDIAESVNNILFSLTSVESQFKNATMNTAQMNSSITEDNSAATDLSNSSFLDSKLPKLFMLLEEHEEHKEFKDITSIVKDDDDCSIKSCDLHHKTLDFLLSSEIERFCCNEGYQDHKDDSNEDSSHDRKGKAERDQEESHPLGSLIDTDRLSNCGSISCRSSSRRSFAFPVLESEWPGSPVRMVEDDRRHRQRRRACFLCF